ncbi:hypothetical protein HUJ04_010243 [Dendroctonus ponderosae]|uniref:TOG domain-containing protein n=1 Tax=Dendroctonus ponderosae TaxID=77166 RepID=A0AAR5QGT8_DENPD|nr:hypothetical protein HUJ04_010243 [Dendroctonus ponderosae]KAH1020615.1 hypothetical protein HUJ04_010243 [Dendroctonus ponderosae]
MKRLLKSMTSNPNLHNSPGLNLFKQRVRTEQNVRNPFESSSFVIPNRIKHKSLIADELKDSSTQTSRTVAALDMAESPRMSPDSLSPKTPKIASTGMQFNRKKYVLRYLHKPDQKETRLSDNSLTKVFLEKARRKSQESSSPRITRSNFLQQTSPLRHIIPTVHVPNFKSHSYAAFPEGPRQTTEAPNPRFKVKSIKEKLPASNSVEPGKFLGDKELTLNLNSPKHSPKSVKNYSFMSPTFSSEQKNKMRDIKNVAQLIAPTRRGRSASPKANVERTPSVPKKVPYIDKSSSSIFHSTGDTSFNLNLKSPKLAVSSSTILETCADGNPEHELVQAMGKMRDPDWNTSLRGLVDIIELCRTVDTNIIYPHMTVINQRIIDMLKSSRSHVCRTTCKAIGHLFEYIKDTRRPEFDEIVDTLLCRTADSNKFIRHDANLALDCMVTHIPILHAVRALCAKGPDHKNALVRISTARLVVCAVVIAGSTYVLHPNNSDYTRRRIVLNMVKFLNDKTLETRKYGERLHRLLCNDRMFDIYIRRYLEKGTIQKLKACFKNPQKNGIR